MTRYLVYDVFTDTPFTGNQLAIFPDATALSEEQLMPLCREFNFSEVTYVYPPQDPANTALVRIFCPGREMVFAGHPTIGTAKALSDLGYGDRLILELGIGPLSCAIDADGVSFSNSAPLKQLSMPDIALVAECLSLPANAIRTDRHAPQIASVGNPFVLVELGDRDTLDQAKPRDQVMEAILQAHPESLDCSIYAYTRDGRDTHARMFGKLGGIPEDPATGSAAAALGAYLAALEGTADLSILQGAQMGRPSRIGVRADRASVTISGQAVRVMDGHLTL
ncbi:MAG: PhzF family phenazine biosynthesis protein [Rhodobacteraceae bacterium]|nr:PhzF family phenazine biosynthesis protein [Paracoccaceae bacterium]